MARRTGKGRPPAPAPRWLLPALVVLLLGGLGVSLHLGHLYLEVQRSGGNVQSFCNINQTFDCVAVATSRYSTFLGLPIALYGIEYFGVLLALTLLGGLSAVRLRRWQSMVFVGATLGIPVSVVLGVISVTSIGAVCVMCVTIYAINLVLFGLLLVVNRGRVGAALVEGPRELARLLAAPRSGALLLVLAGLAVSQFFWVPGLIHDGVPSAEARGTSLGGIPTSGRTAGPGDAPITIEEFTDFQCPYCGMAHRTILRVIKQYPGKIRLIHRDYPLDQDCHPRLNRPFHPDACRAAIYARCAAAQDHYWPYEHLLFENREQLSKDHLERYASRVGLDLDRLRTCVDDPSTRKAVVDDIREGIRRGVSGTPTLFVNGEKIVGFKDEAFWHKKIAALLRGGSNGG